MTEENFNEEETPPEDDDILNVDNLGSRTIEGSQAEEKQGKRIQKTFEELVKTVGLVGHHASVTAFLRKKLKAGELTIDEAKAVSRKYQVVKVKF